MRREFFSFITDRGRFLFGAKANKRRLESQRVRATQNINNNNNTLTAANNNNSSKRWTDELNRMIVKGLLLQSRRGVLATDVIAANLWVVVITKLYRFLWILGTKNDNRTDNKKTLSHTQRECIRENVVGMLKWWGWGLSYVHYIYTYYHTYIVVSNTFGLKEINLVQNIFVEFVFVLSRSFSATRVNGTGREF